MNLLSQCRDNAMAMYINDENVLRSGCIEESLGSGRAFFRFRFCCFVFFYAEGCLCASRSVLETNVSRQFSSALLHSFFILISRETRIRKNLNFS